MKIVTNKKLIKRNSRIGQITTIGALLILGIGLYITFAMPENFTYSMACLVAGFFLSQIGIYYGNRWGRSPRPDEIINKSMKGLGREYTMYHFTTPASHLLIGPSGIWILLPLHQGGKITYNGKRWRSSGGGFTRSYMRIFGQENVGRPDIEAGAEIRSVTRYLERLLPDNMEIPLVRAALLFTDPKVLLDIENTPLPAMRPDKLKEFLKDAAREKPINPAALETLRELLPKPDKE